MISQRRFKAIDDYPLKFDWPGIKGLKIFWGACPGPPYKSEGFALAMIASQS